ncbi:MAG TPA: PqqD family peptide modification chaperone [Gemmatimonadaceae bacterium]|nr:PqqD family peptide modification chaperone [Gemmatimonadaceae bacterium]
MPLPARAFHYMRFNRDSCVVVSDEQVSTSLGDETVILGMEDGVYYGLDAVGARIWALLATPRRVSELVSTILGEFDVTPEQCERDVLALLDDLFDRRLVSEVDGSDAAVS